MRGVARAFAMAGAAAGPVSSTGAIGSSKGTGDDEAVIHGQLAGATAVAILVSGMGSRPRRPHDGPSQAAEHLHLAARRRSPDGIVAVVDWRGYEAPQGIEALLHEPATTGGATLVAYIASLGLAPGTRVTVIGHSYGTVVVGEALRQGLRADAVVVVGSPGMGVDRVAGLGDGNTPIYSARARGDLLGLSEAFGRSPTDPQFGAQRLDTGTDTGHGGYFDAGAGTLEEIAGLMTGHLDEVRLDEADGFERAVSYLDDVVDPSPVLTAAGTVLDAGTAAVETAAQLAGADELAGAAAQVGESAGRALEVLAQAASPDFLVSSVRDLLDF